jgi:large subunit ribosomal protein L21
MYAVVAYQGHQYIIKQGDTLTVDRVDAKEGEVVSIDTVVATFVEDGSSTAVGMPYLPIKISATVESHMRAKKIRVVKFQSKKRYMRTI